jgi:hypothetical protein
MFHLNIFVFIFIVLVGIYIVMNVKTLTKRDTIILAIATLALLFIAVQSSMMQKRQLEHFVESTSKQYEAIDIQSALTKYKRMDIEEDITDIQQRLVVYLTAFNKTSFNNMGRIWYNIAKIQKDGTCESADNSIFNFEMAPVFSRKTGMYLGNNRLVGPYCNALNIQFHNTFTILLVCKHGNLLVDDKNSEIELLKLYANSPNNNGLSLFIQKGSLKNDNNTQVGNLMFQYAQHDPQTCKVDKDHSFINFDRDSLTFYFIVKDTDNVRVLMMNENSNAIQQILKFTITNTDVTFSNKEMVLNRLLNWNGNLFNFAIYDKALSDELVSSFYTHIMNEYLKNIDPNFTVMLSQYNETLDILQSLTKCPYDKNVCDNCTSVGRWCDMNQVLNSSLQCKKSINDFCAANTSHPLCKCWDTSSPIYNTDNCRLYRSIFSGEKTSSFDGLTAEDLEYIKNKYGLVHPHQCPTAIKKPEFITNTYSKYDWNKLKVSLDGERDGKVRPMYPEDTEEVARKAQLAKDDLKYDEAEDWKRRRIADIPGASSKKPVDTAASDSVFSVTNYFKKDPNLSKSLADTETAQQTKEILDSAQKEQQNLLDGSAPHKIYTPEKKATPAVSDPLTDTLPKPDSFFNKFMKVMLPQ